MYYTYMLRCEDGSIYTGITTDLNRRFSEHLKKTDRAAKYTKNHNAKRIEAAWMSGDRVLASKLEFRIKKLSKEKKEALIKESVLDDIDGIDESLYSAVDMANFKEKCEILEDF